MQDNQEPERALPADVERRQQQLYDAGSGVGTARELLAQVDGPLVADVLRRWQYAVDELINFLDVAGVITLGGEGAPPAQK